MTTTTVRFYFRNIMCFIHRDYGTDVWFFSNHQPNVYTREKREKLTGRTVRLLSDGREISGTGMQTNGLERIISMNTLATDAVPHDDVVKKKVSGKLVARLKLPNTGRLSDLPSAHSFGVLLEWKTPFADNKQATHVQRLTEVAMYEIENVPLPVTLALSTDPDKPVEYIDLKPARDGVADAFFISGELSKGPIRNGKIHEFVAIHDCFNDETRKRLEHVIPEATLPRGIDFLSADPFCPGARFDMRTGNK